MKIITLIPARLGSTRLPSKPLADIGGLPMIIQVVNRVKEAGMEDVIVASAEQEIVEIVEKHGCRAILTDPSLPSGTDRIYQALQKTPEYQSVDGILNVQGDLPTISPEVIKDTVSLLKTKLYDITTAVSVIKSADERTNPNVVKAVISWQAEKSGRALYFTRATAPHGDGELYNHIGIYAYTKPALEKFVKLPPSPLEKRERLEQLRALEAGMKIGVVLTDSMPLGVDTAEDLEKARRVLS